MVCPKSSCHVVLSLDQSTHVLFGHHPPCDFSLLLPISASVQRNLPPFSSLPSRRLQVAAASVTIGLRSSSLQAGR